MAWQRHAKTQNRKTASHAGLMSSTVRALAGPMGPSKCGCMPFFKRWRCLYPHDLLRPSFMALPLQCKRRCLTFGDPEKQTTSGTDDKRRPCHSVRQTLVQTQVVICVQKWHPGGRKLAWTRALVAQKVVLSHFFQAPNANMQLNLCSSASLNKAEVMFHSLRLRHSTQSLF